MLTTSELLARLRGKNIKNADIARTLDVSPSRVTEMFDGTRALKLDEAVKLVEAFSLELNGRLDPLPPAVNRLVIRHIAHEFGVAPDESQIAELMQDMRAFSEFVADPKVRRSIDAAEAFFQAMRLRRLSSEKVARQESDPRPAQ